MIRTILYLFTILLGIVTTNAQQITGQIIDSQTNESIPFATIKIGETDLISNNDGYFTVSSDNDTDLITVSFIGYISQTVTIGHLKQNKVIKLVQGAYDIGGIYVSNEAPNADTIINRARKEIRTLYHSTNLKRTIFTRKSNEFTPKTAEVKIKKSTEYSKSEFKKLNKELAEFTSDLVNYPPQQFTDRLVNYHTATKQVDEKPVFMSKVEVIKAVSFKDDKRATDINDLEKTATNLMLKYIDTTKFYRIKSGLFGSRDTISLSEEFNNRPKNKHQKQQPPENKKISQVKRDLNSNNYLFFHPEITFIHSLEHYTYTFVEATYLDNELVYVIDFKPRKRKAKHEGRLYINADDYAILRADYDLPEGKNLNSFNFKLVLGIKGAENISKGTFIYKKTPNSKSYYLHYAYEEKGGYFYVNRPLKLIEITENRKEREMVAFTIKIEGNHLSKSEYLNTSIKPTTHEEVETITEKDFEYEVHNRYNPNIWKGYNVIEPLEEMKNFKSTE